MCNTDYTLKAKCVAAVGKMTTREIYDKVFLPEYGGNMSYESFKRQMRNWKRKAYADEGLLSAGTLPQFIPHGATVQVNASGEVTQVWVKEHADIDWLSIRDIITQEVKRSDIQPSIIGGDTMLEIPLFDMHFGIATIDYYKETLTDLLSVVYKHNYDEINILFGQDVLHNNDMRGHTAKGTDIQKIDFPQAWADAWQFFRILIDAALKQSPRVNLHYSKGNHDECAAWCMFKALQSVYPQCYCDDSLAPRKCIFWRGCFIGFGHCEYAKQNAKLFQNFVLDFPKEFADAKVREIHSGHLHRESIDDGMMVRRLPSGVPTDEWSSNNGYTGAHKRFMVFEWAENRLKATYYV